MYVYIYVKRDLYARPIYVVFLTHTNTNLTTVCRKRTSTRSGSDIHESKEKIRAYRAFSKATRLFLAK